MSPIKRFFSILALTAMWSPSFLFIKLAVNEIPPITIVASRVSLGAIGFVAILLWLRRPFPRAPLFWVHSTMMALLGSIIPFYLFCCAEETIESSLAAIINGTTPMFTALLAQFFVVSDKMNLKKAIGIILSLGGLIPLFAPDILQGFSSSALGMMIATLAAFNYAVGHIYAKKYIVGQQPFIAPAAQLLVSSALLIPLSFVFEAPWNLPSPSLSAMGGIAGMAVIGTFCGSLLYYYVMEHCGPTAVSMVACLIPACGMVLGYLFLNEMITFGSLLASSLILLGMMTVNDVIPVPFRRAQKAQPL